MVPRAPISQSLVTAPISHPLQIMSLQQKHSDIVAAEAEAEADSEAEAEAERSRMLEEAEDKLHIPTDLQRLLPATLRKISIVVRIAEYSVGKHEQERRQAEYHAGETIKNAMQMHNDACIQMQKADTYTDADAEARTWTLSRLGKLDMGKALIVLSRLGRPEYSGQKIDVADTAKQLHDRRKSAVAEAQKLYGQTLMEKFVENQLVENGLRISKWWRDWWRDWNVLMIEILMFRCQAACKKPDDQKEFQGQLADVFVLPEHTTTANLIASAQDYLVLQKLDPCSSQCFFKKEQVFSLDFTTKNQLRLCHSIKQFEKVTDLQKINVTITEGLNLLAMIITEAWRVRSIAWITDAVDPGGEERRERQALTSTALKALIGSGGPLAETSLIVSGYESIHVALHAESLVVSGTCRNLLGLQRSRALARELRDLGVGLMEKKMVENYCENSRDKFLSLAAEAYGGQVDKEVKARLLLSYHKMHKGFRSINSQRNQRVRR